VQSVKKRLPEIKMWLRPEGRMTAAETAGVHCVVGLTNLKRRNQAPGSCGLLVNPSAGIPRLR
jgi:hypothetical protein